MEVSQLALNIAAIEGIILGCILLYRTLRIFPTYVKTGTIGDMNHMLMGGGLRLKWLLTETHPLTIILDGILSVLLIFITMALASVLLYIIAIALAFYGIYRLAIYMRERYVNKEQFVKALKGK